MSLKRLLTLGVWAVAILFAIYLAFALTFAAAYAVFHPPSLSKVQWGSIGLLIPQTIVLVLVARWLSGKPLRGVPKLAAWAVGVTVPLIALAMVLGWVAAVAIMVGVLLFIFWPNRKRAAAQAPPGEGDAPKPDEPVPASDVQG